jgi:hypothetical protein
VPVEEYLEIVQKTILGDATQKFIATSDRSPERQARYDLTLRRYREHHDRHQEFGHKGFVLDNDQRFI